MTSQEDPGFLETLANGAEAVDGAVDVALRGARGGDGAVLRAEVSAWENMGGGERGGCLDAVEEENLVLGRDQENAVASIVSWDMAMVMGVGCRTWSSGEVPDLAASPCEFVVVEEAWLCLFASLFSVLFFGFSALDLVRTRMQNALAVSVCFRCVEMLILRNARVS